MTKTSRWMEKLLEESAQTPNLLASSRQARAARRAEAARPIEQKAA